MIIYVDLLILINFFIDMLILIGTSVLLKRKTSFIRIIIGAFIGSISCLLLFYIHDNITLLVYKLLISMLMIIISFKYNSFRYFKDNLIWLYIISIVLGGSIYLVNDNISLKNNALVFNKNGMEINLILLLVLSPFIIYKYITQNRRREIVYSNYYDISIYYDNEVINDIGFLDTGNNLKDPFFSRPIILINKSLMRKKVNTFLIPFYTVNNHDLLEVFKPKKVIVNNRIIKRVLIGITDVNIDGIKIILNKEVL